MFILSVVVATLAAGPAIAAPPATSWALVDAPTDGPPQVFGRYDSSCIAGAVPLPLDGVGYQAADPSRRRFYGHPTLVSYVRDLGRAVAERRLGSMLVGDLAQPRGGPMSFGHVSHQGGLDVDIWFRMDVPPLPPTQRDGLALPAVVDPATGRPDPALWSAGNAQLVHLAATDPRVSRVFVGAAIKRDLCERSWPDRAWLNVVRAWPGHDDHLHVRLRCPPNSPACVDQPPLPAGDTCSPAAIASTLARERALRHRVGRRPNANVPSACGPLLATQNAPSSPRPVVTLQKRENLGRTVADRGDVRPLGVVAGVPAESSRGAPESGPR